MKELTEKDIQDMYKGAADQFIEGGNTYEGYIYFIDLVDTLRDKLGLEVDNVWRVAEE